MKNWQRDLLVGIVGTVVGSTLADVVPDLWRWAEVLWWVVPSYPAGTVMTFAAAGGIVSVWLHRRVPGAGQAVAVGVSVGSTVGGGVVAMALGDVGGGLAISAVAVVAVLLTVLDR